MTHNNQTQSLNPATGEFLGYSGLNTVAEVKEAVGRARDAQAALGGHAFEAAQSRRAQDTRPDRPTGR